MKGSNDSALNYTEKREKRWRSEGTTFLRSLPALPNLFRPPTGTCISLDHPSPNPNEPPHSMTCRALGRRLTSTLVFMLPT